MKTCSNAGTGSGISTDVGGRVLPSETWDVMGSILQMMGP